MLAASVTSSILFPLDALISSIIAAGAVAVDLGVSARASRIGFLQLATLRLLTIDRILSREASPTPPLHNDPGAPANHRATGAQRLVQSSSAPQIDETSRDQGSESNDLS
jgi:hypothetical protein